MIMRILLYLIFALFACSCSAEKDSLNNLEYDVVASNKDVKSAFELFSKAVSEKNIDLFINLANPNGVHLVRKFTSGTLGGRGAELSELTDPKKIDGKIQFPIRNQTPYNIRIQFQELPIKSFENLSHQSLAVEIENLDFDRWTPFLKQSLVGTPESSSRMPIVLSSVNAKYYVYAEAQIIDDILVGGFAVFSMIEGKLKLVALIELL